MKRDIEPVVYLLAGHKYGTLYVGVTSNLMKRLYEHREELLEGFSKDKGAKRLVWFERHDTMETAIRREKQIKKMEEAVENKFDRARQCRLARFGG